MTQLAEFDLAALTALEAKATKGPWRQAVNRQDADCWWGARGDNDIVVCAGEVGMAEPVAATCDDHLPTQGDAWNAEFIAALRNAAPELIALAREALDRRTYERMLR